MCIRDSVIASGSCCFALPLVTEIEALYVPALALLAATILNTLLPDPGAESVTGVKVAVIPLGNPVTEKPTAALNPPLTVTVSVML